MLGADTQIDELKDHMGQIIEEEREDLLSDTELEALLVLDNGSNLN